MAADKNTATGEDDVLMILDVLNKRCRIDYYDDTKESAIAAVGDFLESHTSVIDPPPHSLLHVAFRNFQNVIQGFLTPSTVSTYFVSPSQSVKVNNYAKHHLGVAHESPFIDTEQPESQLMRRRTIIQLGWHLTY